MLGVFACTPMSKYIMLVTIMVTSACAPVDYREYVTDDGDTLPASGPTYVTPFGLGYAASGPTGTSYITPFGLGWVISD